ncbi:MAG: DUF421 domain-containing protein [Candidatus Krumholzibacteriia bacterium]
MFDWSWTVLLGIMARTAIVYVLLLVGIRLAGKREIGQLTPFDLVVLLLLSNAVQNAMTGPDTSVTGGVAAALTLLLVNAGVARLGLRSGRWRRFVEGIPVVLVTHGEVHYRALAREHLAYEELLVALRQHEVSSVEEVELAMLEVDGSVTVIRRDPGRPGQVLHSRRRLVRHHRNNN